MELECISVPSCRRVTDFQKCSVIGPTCVCVLCSEQQLTRLVDCSLQSGRVCVNDLFIIVWIPIRLNEYVPLYHRHGWMWHLTTDYQKKTRDWKFDVNCSGICRLHDMLTSIIVNGLSFPGARFPGAWDSRPFFIPEFPGMVMANSRIK